MPYKDSFLFCLGFPSGSVVKNPPTNAGDTGDTALIPGSERSPGEGNDNPLQYSCLGNPMDREASQEALCMESQRVGHNWVTEHALLSDFFSSLLKTRQGITETEQNPMVLAPHYVLCLIFVCGKLRSKTKFNQKTEKWGNKGNSQRRLKNNNVVIKHSQRPLALFQAL